MTPEMVPKIPMMALKIPKMACKIPMMAALGAIFGHLGNPGSNNNTATTTAS